MLPADDGRPCGGGLLCTIPASLDDVKGERKTAVHGLFWDETTRTLAVELLKPRTRMGFRQAGNLSSRRGVTQNDIFFWKQTLPAS